MLLSPQVKMKACVQSGLSSVEGLQFWSHTVLAGGSIILINHICEINVFCALIVNAYMSLKFCALSIRKDVSPFGAGAG